MENKNEVNYTGVNRLLKSSSLQQILNKLDDGTFSTFLDDWKWIFSYSRKYKWAIAFYVFLGFFSSTLSIGSSLVSKYLIDIIVGKKLDQLWLLIFLMVFSTVFSLVFSSLVSRVSAKINIYVNNDIQADIFRKIISSDWMALHRYAHGDLLNRFNSDVSTVASNAVSWLPQLIISVYNFIASLLVILWYDPTMALIALLSAPFLMAASRFIMRRMRHYRQRVMEMNSKLMSFEVETFYNMDTIKSFGIVDRYGAELEKWQGKYREHNLEYNLFSIKTNVLLKLISTFVGFVSFGYCLFRLWTNSITYGTMTLFLQQRSTLTAEFNSLVGMLPGMLNSSVSAHRIRELVELPREKVDPEAAEKIRNTARNGLTVRMRRVEFSYEDQTNVISKGDFVAKPGEIVALVGPSGEGKTTMLRLILGLVTPESGRVTLSGSDGSEVEMSADIRQFFSYVPQGNTMIAGTIAENLRMVREDATDEEIIQALKDACAWDFVSRLPDGIYYALGERGRGLSEGQSQRVAIARAVLRNAPILLLDEATSALDVSTERQVLKNIITRHPNKTCIVTTHRPSVLNLCQRVYRVMETRVTSLSEEESSRMAMDF